VDGIRPPLSHEESTTINGRARPPAAESSVVLRRKSNRRALITAKAGRATVLEVDRLGARGLKNMEGVVSRVDRVGRTMSIASPMDPHRRCDARIRAATDVDATRISRRDASGW